MWVKCGARWWFLLQERYIPVPISRCAPCSAMRDPRCVTCASWERGPKLLWTWPSSVCMVDSDFCKSCLHWLFTPDWVLCAVGHGDLGGDPAGPLSWKTPCLHLNVSAQMSRVWSQGGFVWVTVLFSEWSSMALSGVSAEAGLLVFPSDEFTSPGLIETPQAGHLVVVLQSLSLSSS